MEGKGVGLAKYAMIRGGSVTSTELVGQMNRQKLCDSHRGGPKTHDFDLRVVECIGGGGREASRLFCHVSVRMSHLITVDSGGECPAVTPVLPTHVLVAVKCSYCGRETIVRFTYSYAFDYGNYFISRKYFK